LGNKKTSIADEEKIQDAGGGVEMEDMCVIWRSPRGREDMQFKRTLLVDVEEAPEAAVVWLCENDPVTEMFESCDGEKSRRYRSHNRR
jgi:hypothetical protein